jgi:hypothetical protein
MKQLKLIALTLLLLVGVAKAQNYELRGSVRGWTRAFIEDPHTVDLAQAKLKLELVSTLGMNTAMFVRTYATSEKFRGNLYGTADPQEDVTLDLQEAYIDYYNDWLSLRMGRQVMTWGKADEINPTDVLSPQDLTNMMEDKIIRKQGLFAIKANWLFYDFDLETIWKPEHGYFLLPSTDSPWSFMDAPGGRTIMEPTQPGNELGDMEWGIRLSRTVSMFDFSAVWYDGWDNIASNDILNNPVGSPWLMTRFYRTRMAGGSFAASIGSIGVWGEGAYFITEDQDSNINYIRNNYIQYVIGTDYTFYNGLKINVQYFEEIKTGIDDDMEELMEDIYPTALGIGLQLDRAMTARLEYAFGFGESQSIEIFTLADLEESGFMIGPKYRISPEPAVEFEFGGVVLVGNEESLYGRFDNNSHVYLKCTYSF